MNCEVFLSEPQICLAGLEEYEPLFSSIRCSGRKLGFSQERGVTDSALVMLLNSRNIKLLDGIEVSLKDDVESFYFQPQMDNLTTFLFLSSRG